MAPRPAPILCLEGPSAVGKSTVASVLADAHGAHAVPEVTALFARPVDEPPDWYLDRQADRWATATAAARHRPLVVLDGDPFQPLWYNWAYGFAGRQSLDDLVAFYRPRLVQGDLGFPDRYVVFEASVKTLRERKAADATRRRGRFEEHLRFVAPQRRYFEAVQRFSPERVCVLGARDVSASVEAVLDAVRQATAETRPVDLFDHLTAWLRTNPAS